jgi:hypothetical protein
MTDKKLYDDLNFPDRARKSCSDLQDHAPKELELPAFTDPAAVEVFASTFLNAEEVRSIGSSLAVSHNDTRMDGTFESVKHEAGLIVLMHALDFGGGWRQELHSFHGKGAFATVKPGVENIYQAQPNLTASWLARLSQKEVGGMFGLAGSKELEPFVECLTRVCNEVGNGVIAAGCENVGDYIDGKLEIAQTTEAPAAALVEALVGSFPYTFNDVHEIAGRPVIFYKKAQLVVGELGHRFRKEDSRFDFNDFSNLTAFIDNVIVAVLRKHGVVATTTELADKIDSHVHLPSGSVEEVSLRAAAMVGVETVAAKLRLDPCEVGNYLWGYLGKQPDHRKYQRHATKNTVFY